MITLYYRALACSLAARIAIYEAGLDAEFVAVDFTTKLLADAGTDYHEIWALGKVPVLETASGRIAEASAVLQAIADMAPDSGLAPRAGTHDRIILQQWLSFVGTELHKATIYPHFADGRNDGAKEFAQAQGRCAFPVVAAALNDRQFLLGEQFTVADCYLFWALIVAQFRGLDVPAPLQGYVARVLSRPAVAKALAEERAEAGR